MLILQRKAGESVLIGDNITVSVQSIENGRVRLAIDAPNSIPILRSELVATIEVNQDSVVQDTASASLQELLGTVLDHPHA